MFVFSEFNSISKAEISELIETKTKMMETEIELIKAKCLSEAEIIKLIKSNKIKSAPPVSRDNFLEYPEEAPTLDYPNDTGYLIAKCEK